MQEASHVYSRESCEVLQPCWSQCNGARVSSSLSLVGVRSSPSLPLCSVALDFHFFLFLLQISSPCHYVVGYARAYTFTNGMLVLLYNYIIGYIYEIKIKMTESFVKDLFLLSLGSV